MINWKTKAKFIFYLKKLNRTPILSYKGENIPRHFISYITLLTIFKTMGYHYLTKLIRRYERYNDFKEKQNNNESTYHNDLDKLNKNKESNPQLLLTMDDVDNELDNLINNQFKNLNTEKQFNVINDTNKKLS